MFLPDHSRRELVIFCGKVNLFFRCHLFVRKNNNKLSAFQKFNSLYIFDKIVFVWSIVLCVQIVFEVVSPE